MNFADAFARFLKILRTLDDDDLWNVPLEVQHSSVGDPQSDRKVIVDLEAEIVSKIVEIAEPEGVWVRPDGDQPAPHSQLTIIAVDPEDLTVLEKARSTASELAREIAKRMPPGCCAWVELIFDCFRRGTGRGANLGIWWSIVPDPLDLWKSGERRK